MLRKYTTIFTCACTIVLGTGIHAQAGASAADPEPELKTSEKTFVSVLQPGDHPLYSLVTRRFQQQGRFNFLPIDYGSGNSIDIKDFIARFQQYQRENAGKLAGKGAPDFKFGNVTITGKQIDKMVKSSFVIVPTWRSTPVVLGKEEVISNDDGTVTKKVKASAQLELQAEIISASSGVALGKLVRSEEVARTLTVTLGGPLGGSETAYEAAKEQVANRPVFVALNEETLATADKVMTFIMTDTRKLEAFRLRTFFGASKDNQLTFQAGSSLGVVHDSPFDVIRKVETDKGSNYEEVGFIKIRDLGENQATFQTIRDSVGFEEGDLLVEHPQSGYFGNLRFGILSYDPFGGSANRIAPAVMIGGESDLGTLMRQNGLSETYATADFNLALGASGNVGAQTLVGIKKQFYLYQFVLSLGLKGGYLAELAGGSFRNNGLGAGPAVGLDIQANPDLKVGIQAGYIAALGTGGNFNGVNASAGANWSF